MRLRVGLIQKQNHGTFFCLTENITDLLIYMCAISFLPELTIILVNVVQIPGWNRCI